MSIILKKQKIYVLLLPVAHVATAHAIFLRFRTDVTISALTALSPMREALAETQL